VGLGLVLVGVAAALPSPEIQVFVLGVPLLGVLAAWWASYASKSEPTVTPTMFTAALSAKFVGAVARFAILELVYKVGDAVRYHGAGVENYRRVRAFDFSFVQAGDLGTEFLENVVAFVYAITGPSLVAGFLVFTSLSFIGTWCFYRAHRVAFPDGNYRLYFILLFFLPTMVFWPSSLGKDALMVFGLGLGTLGLAKLLRRPTWGGGAQFLAGSWVAFMVRPVIGIILFGGAVTALIIHPGRRVDRYSYPLKVLVATPLLVIGLVVGLRTAFAYERIEFSVGGVVQSHQGLQETLSEGGSEFQPPSLTAPGEAVNAAITVMFRPYPWEVTNVQAAIAGVEGLVFLSLVVLRLKSGIRAVRVRWRGGMIVAVVLVALGILAALSSFANFGLLVRQRSQLLPFLFLLLTAAPPVLRRRRARSRHRVRVRPEPELELEPAPAL
jgi:hypothetical protein